MTNLALAKLQALSLSNHLAHAWLFIGPSPTEKLQIANSFSQWLFCNQTCGICKNCQLFVAGTHPDFCIITMQENHATITVDQIRSLNQFVTSKPQLAAKKVVLLYPAEKMLEQAANALLKILEEPGADTVLILLAENPNLLLSTIVSRCQQLRFDVVNAIDPQFATASEMVFKDLHNLWVTKSITVTGLSEVWVKRWPNEVLYWFELALGDLIKCRYTRDAELLSDPANYNVLVELNSKLTDGKLWTILDKLQQARYWLGRGHRPNLQLILEDSLI